MAVRKIVEIDEEKCDGCGLCVPKCAENAIVIENGKAKLSAENLCDGLGACLGECPQDAITIEERPAEAFDERAVEAQKCAQGNNVAGISGGCPGSMLRKLNAQSPPADGPVGSSRSQLGQWPVQLTLVPPVGDIWQGADVLLAADCAAYAMGDFHDRLLAGKTLAVACPKLDDCDAYVAKLTTIFAGNAIRSITIARMEVPCCSGLERIVQEAISRAGREIPITIVEISVGGQILNTSHGED